MHIVRLVMHEWQFQEGFLESPHGASSSAGKHPEGVPSDEDRIEECPLCLEKVTEFGVMAPCNHITCMSCMKYYIMCEVMESRVNITCPQCEILMIPSRESFANGWGVTLGGNLKENVS